MLSTQLNLSRLWQLVEPCQRLTATLTSHGLPLAAAADLLQQLLPAEPACTPSPELPPTSSFTIPQQLQQELSAQLQLILSSLHQGLLPSAVETQLQQVTGPGAYDALQVDQDQEEELKARQLECQRTYAKELQECHQLAQEQQEQQLPHADQQKQDERQDVLCRGLDQKPRAMPAAGAAAAAIGARRSLATSASEYLEKQGLLGSRELPVVNGVEGKGSVLRKRKREREEGGSACQLQQEQHKQFMPRADVYQALCRDQDEKIRDRPAAGAAGTGCSSSFVGGVIGFWDKGGLLEDGGLSLGRGAEGKQCVLGKRNRRFFVREDGDKSGNGGVRPQGQGPVEVAVALAAATAAAAAAAAAAAGAVFNHGSRPSNQMSETAGLQREGLIQQQSSSISLEPAAAVAACCPVPEDPVLRHVSDAEWSYDGPFLSKPHLACISTYPKDCTEPADQEDFLQLVLLVLWFKLAVSAPPQPNRSAVAFGWGDARWYLSSTWIPSHIYPAPIGLLEQLGMGLISYLSLGKAPALLLINFSTKAGAVHHMNVRPEHGFVRILVEGTYLAKRMALLTRRARQLVGKQGCALVNNLMRPGTPEALYAEVRV